MTKKLVKDTLIIGVDFSDSDKQILGVARVGEDNKILAINQVWGQEAVDLYNRLITYAQGGKDEK